ncbi:flagellar biosynthesis protein [Paenibacillus polysaccharolyticus]|uniref:Flagellar biosynthesis protein n=2 Tax=Paenibacillus TaxID=44249 RepID=A0ABS7KQ81_9BACL|nr:TIGR02530 family flagellar biosynthesis protein [Paenibacillus cucumis (ex Kampfer et al. 2016)]MBY0206131.1 flagellar biosynthesis protein [Paenibacillus cucumis (ex Kampfer et al. 2016)]MDP9698490.1 flagellar operon protein [Paenibacillus intestini]
MSDRITVGQLYTGPVTPNMLRKPQTGDTSGTPSKPFAQVLEDNLLKLSNHAAKRLEQRGIELKTEQMKQIGSALDKAAAKGAKESLILMQDMAFIVNVKNRTVVTAMDSESMKDNVFTQIDSAVIIS